MKRLASFILAFIFLASNLGFAVGTHFCGGHAIEAAVVLGHKNLSCGMMPEVVNPIEHSHTILQSVPCCKDEFHSLQIDDDIQHSHSTVDVEPLATLTPLFILAAVSPAVNDTHLFPLYPPPIRTEKVSILLQVFRI